MPFFAQSLRGALLVVSVARADGGAGIPVTSPTPGSGTPVSPTPSAPASPATSAAPTTAPPAAPMRWGVPLPGTSPPPSYETLLTESKDGSGDLLYEATAFSARIAPDGAVVFRDKHASLLSLLSFLPVAGPRNVPTLQSTVKGLIRQGKVPPQNDRATNDSSFLVIPLLTPYRPDPQEADRSRSTPLSILPVSVTGRFDLTDEVMRMSGQDPYRYEKARFLVGTRELRVRRAVRFRAADVRKAGTDLPRQLVEIACDSRRSLRERHDIIVSLRNDLDGSAPEGRAAIAEIDRFLASGMRRIDAGQPCATPSTTR